MIFKILKKIKNINIKNILKNNRIIKSIKNCKETLEKCGEIKEYILKTLIDLNDKPDSIIYLFKINKDDCLHLKEIIKQCDQKYVLENDIDDLLKCIEIASKLGSLNEFPKKVLTQIIKSLKT